MSRGHLATGSFCRQLQLKTENENKQQHQQQPFSFRFSFFASCSQSLFFAAVKAVWPRFTDNKKKNQTFKGKLLNVININTALNVLLLLPMPMLMLVFKFNTVCMPKPIHFFFQQIFHRRFLFFSLFFFFFCFKQFSNMQLIKHTYIHAYIHAYIHTYISMSD